MDREETINLSALMIRHIARIANTTRAHDLGYGFLLTKVFEHFGIELKKKVAAQIIDEIGTDTLMGCGYALAEGSASKQGTRPPRPVPGRSSGKLEAVLQDNSRLMEELSAVKAVLDEEKALSLSNAMKTSWPFSLLLLPKSFLHSHHHLLLPNSVGCFLVFSSLSLYFILVLYLSGLLMKSIVVANTM